MGGESKESEDENKETYITDEEGEIVISYIAPGTYHIREIKSQPGYVCDETTYEVVVDEQGLIEGEPEKEIVVANDYTKVQVEKNDFVTGKPVKDAQLSIIDEKGKEIENWKTDGKPHYMEKLVPGEYILKEVTAPEGYEKAEQVKFTVKETGEIQVVEMLDRPIPKKSGSIKTGDPMGGLLRWVLIVLIVSGSGTAFMCHIRKHRGN